MAKSAEFKVFDENSSFVDTLQTAAQKMKLHPAAIISLFGFGFRPRGAQESLYSDVLQIMREQIEEAHSVVIFCDFRKEVTIYAEDERLHRLMALYKRSSFIEMPFLISDLKGLIEDLYSRPDIKDISIPHLLSVEATNKEINSLHHVSYMLKGTPGQGAREIKRVNVLFGTNFDVINGGEEAYQYLSKRRETSRKRAIFHGHKLNGIFCDLDGTLFYKNTKRINPSVLEWLKQRERDSFVHLWTGGNPEEVRPALLNEGITWVVFSKDEFRNTRPEIVVDDMDMETFKREYGIRPQTFIPVQEIMS